MDWLAHSIAPLPQDRQDQCFLISDGVCVTADVDMFSCFGVTWLFYRILFKIDFVSGSTLVRPLSSTWALAFGEARPFRARTEPIKERWL